VTDPAQPQPAQEPIDDEASGRVSRWRWTAPLLSVAVLGWLVARVTTCEESAQPEPKVEIVLPGDRPAAVEPAVAPAPGVADPAQPDPPVAEDMDVMSGTKSGVIGLGLRRTGGNSPSDLPPAESPPPEPAP
jgi:hypothetical protein